MESARPSTNRNPAAALWRPEALAEAWCLRWCVAARISCGASDPPRMTAGVARRAGLAAAALAPATREVVANRARTDLARICVIAAPYGQSKRNQWAVGGVWGMPPAPATRQAPHRPLRVLWPRRPTGARSARR